MKAVKILIRDMETLKINWIKTSYNELTLRYDTYYYAFLRGNALLYIGISYKQNVKYEINQTLRRLRINIIGLIIWLGYVDLNNTTYMRITEQIISDGECLMIFTNQPSYNEQCKESYIGRCNFRIRTTGCTLIRRCVKCEHNQIYFTC